MGPDHRPPGGAAIAADDVRTAARRLGVRLEGRPHGVDASSGAGVWRARTDAGDDAVLKFTSATRGPRDLSSARRELRVYRELAATIPVRTPPLIGALDDDGGVAILLGAAGAARPAPRWHGPDWTALGTSLGRRHAMPLPAGGPWERDDPTFAALDRTDRLAVHAFWRDRLDGLDRIVASGARLRAAAGALGPVFVHGDCHVGNVLHDGGTHDGSTHGDDPVLCDWQSAGIGRPATDLAFPSVRAAPSGTAVPGALVEAYLRERRCDGRALRRAVLAEELLVLVFLWPEYAALNAPEAVARVVRRTRRLAGCWFADEPADDG